MRTFHIAISCFSFLTACSLFVDTSLPPKAVAVDGGDQPTLDAALAPKDAGTTVTDAPVQTEDASADARSLTSFFDDFNRADGPVGNNWFMKTPGTFLIRNSSAEKQRLDSSLYFDNVLMRPASEDRGNVEASVIFTLNGLESSAQLYVRAQRSTLATPQTLDAYFIYVEKEGELFLYRQHGTVFETAGILDQKAIPSFALGERYKLVLSAVNSGSAVSLSGQILRASNGALLQTVASVDSAANRINTPGATGLSGRPAAYPIYDDFRWRELP
jgi:hypothetical protein